MEAQKLHEDLELFFGVLEDAAAVFDIWQACQQSHSEQETVDMFNNAYPGVFPRIEHALLADSVNTLYFLNEKRKDTLNFGTLLLQFRASLSDASYSEVKEKVASLKPVWLKLGVLRNEIFAHRTSRRAMDDSFNKANITPNEIEAYINASQHIVQRLGIVRFGVTYHFTPGGNATMAKLIQELRSNYSVNRTLTS